MTLEQLTQAAQNVAIPDRELAIELLTELAKVSELPYLQKIAAIESFMTEKRLLVLKNIEV